MKKVGIWIDKKEAKIVSMIDGNRALDSVLSLIEDYNIGGGSGSKVKGGPQDVVQDSKYLEREKHQLAKFFKAIVDRVPDTESIVIFGPAQTGHKLFKELSENYTNLYKKVIAVEKADAMTDNQIMAWVKDYYKSVSI